MSSPPPPPLEQTTHTHTHTHTHTYTHIHTHTHIHRERERERERERGNVFEQVMNGWLSCFRESQGYTTFAVKRADEVNCFHRVM